MKTSFFQTFLKTSSLAGFILLLSFVALKAQDIQYTFANIQSTDAGPFGSIEFDVMIQSSSDFTLGSGQVYLNYNTAAFGKNAFSSGQAIITVPPGEAYLLDQKDERIENLPAYAPPVLNNNTDSRLSIAFSQNIKGAFANPNVIDKAKKLFHVRFDFTSANFTGSPNICFEDSSPFDNQTFMAPKQTDNSGGSDSGTQIVNDIFDCTFAYTPPQTIHRGDELDVSLFPVPAKDFVNVLFYAPNQRLVEANLLDKQGRLIITKNQSLIKGESTWKLDTSTLPPGVYYLKLKDDQLMITKKIIVIQ